MFTTTAILHHIDEFDICIFNHVLMLLHLEILIVCILNLFANVAVKML